MDRYIIHDSGNDNITRDGNNNIAIGDNGHYYSVFADTKHNKMVIMDKMTLGSEYIDNCYFGIENENNE